MEKAVGSPFCQQDYLQYYYFFLRHVKCSGAPIKQIIVYVCNGKAVIYQAG